MASILIITINIIIIVIFTTLAALAAEVGDSPTVSSCLRAPNVPTYFIGSKLHSCFSFD